MTRSPSRRSAPACATPDRRVNQAGRPFTLSQLHRPLRVTDGVGSSSAGGRGGEKSPSPFTDNVRPISPEELRRIFNGPPEDFRPVRHITVKPAIDWRRIGNALIAAVLIGNLIFWTAQVVRMVVE